MDEPINADEFKGKVKMHYHNDPKKVRYFTPAAVESVKPLWVLAEDQSLPEGIKKKSPVVAPVGNVKVNEDVLAEARQKYEDTASLPGGEKHADYMTWTAPRLFVEAATMKKRLAGPGAKATEPIVEPAKVEAPVSETKTAPSEEKPKRGRKKKATTAA